MSGLSKKESRNQPVDLDIDPELAPEQNQNQDLVQTTLPVVESEPAQTLHVTPPTNTSKLPVRGATLRGRIKRVLQEKNSELKQFRASKKSTNESAGYYIVDFDRKESTGPFRDMEVLARELGVLQPWERLATE